MPLQGFPRQSATDLFNKMCAELDLNGAPRTIPEALDSDPNADLLAEFRDTQPSRSIQLRCQRLIATIRSSCLKLRITPNLQ
jgi:hypothetical protein